MEFKPHGLSLGSLAREGITVIHTSAAHFLIQSLSLGRLPKHFTSRVSVPTPFIMETWFFASSQKLLSSTDRGTEVQQEKEDDYSTT